MASRSRIAELSSIIQTETEAIDSHIGSQNLTPPSWDLDTPSEVSLSGPARESRVKLLDALDELKALVQGPVPYLFAKVTEGQNTLLGLEAIARFDLASTFAIAGSASFAQISEACGIAEDDVRRLLRFAMTDFIFKEPQRGRVMHTPASRALAEDTGLRNFVIQACAEMWPAASRTVDAMVKWPRSQEPTQTGFNLANETENPIFVEVAKNPARAERFAKATEWFHRNERYADRHVVEGYDWSVLGHGLLVDVGGSHGTMSKAILEHFPQMRCVVQDNASAIESAEVPENLTGRIEFIAHNFFSEQNVVADVYLLRWVLHNWSDLYALMILKQLIPALRHGAKVIVVEMCLPEPGVLSLTEERQARMMDISMKQILNARERSAEDWSQLFYEADPRFQLVQINRPQLSELSIIEFCWQGG